jgi:hypothetical protein
MVGTAFMTWHYGPATVNCAGANAETLGERFEYLIPGILTKRNIPRWPPDIFCLCAAALHLSGAYSQVVEDRPPHVKGKKSGTRAKLLGGLGEQWRLRALDKRKMPDLLQVWWTTVLEHRNIELASIPSSPKCFVALLNLLASADESCFNIGIFAPNTSDADAFSDEATGHLTFGLLGQGSTLCRDIDPSRARVLPKMHTAQNGLTVRSLSHNLAYCFSPDIRPEWVSVAPDNNHHCFNLLIIAWPPKIDPCQFKATRKAYVGDRIGSGSHGLFTFAMAKGPSAKHVL